MRARRWLTGALAAAALTGAGGAGSASAAVSPIGAHSMLQLNDPPSFMQAMFSEAAAMGASTIRLDVAPALVFGDSSSDPDFSGLDEVMALATQYHLRVVADLMTVPSWLADCPAPMSPSDAARCGTDDLARYGSLIGQIVAHADPAIRDWELWNEPDSSQFFHGTPSQYAWMLRTAHDAVKQVDPQAQVLLGGISGTAGSGWLSQVLAVPGADAAHAFDVANVHERGRLDQLAGDLRAWRAMFAGAGFTGPLWVTEHGYPSDPAFQYDPGYAGGAASQAGFLTASLPTLLDAGAAEVLVTERDNLGGAFASEGVLGGDVTDPPAADPQPIEKPAFGAVRAVVGCYVALGRECPGPAPVASPAAMALPAAALRSASQATVTVSDPGAGPVALGAASLAGVAPGPLAVSADGCSGLILEPDERCTITVRFTPATSGSVAGLLQLPSDQGALAVPVGATSPSVGDLTHLPVHVVGRTPDGVGHLQRLSITFANPLAGPVHIDAAQASGPGFAVASDGCARLALAASARCTIIVRWRPPRPGVGRGTLALRGDGEPLHITVAARAYPLPRVTALRGAGRADCLAPGGGTVWATVDQRAAVTWAARRARHAPDRRCAASHPGRARPGRVARGRVRVGLAVRGRRPPGTYRLTAHATNRHGRGPARTLWLTVP